MSNQLPICFVMMPYDTKTDPKTGNEIDFNALYEKGIAEGIRGAGLSPLRSDMDRVGGLIQKSMFERLILCDYAVADLTTANANVFYELGIRHAARPHTTVCIVSDPRSIPFNIASLRTQVYQFLPDGSVDYSGIAAALKDQLSELVRNRGQHDDSPLFNLLTGYSPPPIDRLKTDSFREQIAYAEAAKRRLGQARTLDTEDAALDALREIETDLGNKDLVEAGILVDLLLSYRAIGAFDEMVRVVDELPEFLARSRLVSEQYGFALNRLGRGDEALSVLQPLVDQGASSETYGLIGRVWKDKWERALADGREHVAMGYLSRAIDAYRNGFEADWRDAYPGVNLATLLEIRGDPESVDLAGRMRPVVEYAARRRVEDGVCDYWDHATLLELSVLSRDEDGASGHLNLALGAIRERWEPQTTARNLGMILAVRNQRGEPCGWLENIIGTLLRETR